MAEKVVFILVDGMRSDGMLACGHPFASEFIKLSTHSLNAQTVMPSVTLPCHMSLFHSVKPERHGIISNLYVPQVRPINGLFERLDLFGKKCAMFYSWEELRDVVRPGHMHTSVCYNLHKQENSDRKLTEAAISYIKQEQPDCLFLYLGQTDEVGHTYGWMSEQYLTCVYNAWGLIERLYRELPEGYSLITLADHGGHERTHGTESPEDMTIPVCFFGKRFTPNAEIEGVTILDVAPTVAALLEVPPDPEWEGSPRCK